MAGIVVIAWPGVTALALVIMFAIFVFVDALLQALRAFSADAPVRSPATSRSRRSTSWPG